MGNSLFSASEQPVDLQDVKKFASKVYSADNVAFLTTGQSDFSSNLSSYFNDLTATGQVSSQPSKYFGGEQRYSLSHDGHSHPSAFIAWGSTSPSPAHNVLAELLGGQSNIKWSRGLSPLSAIEEGNVNALNFDYSDANLFGFTVESSTDLNVKTASQKAVAALKAVAQNGVESAQLQSAIAKSKFNYTLYADSAQGWKQLNGEGLINNNLKSLDQVLGEFDGVSTTSIQQVSPAYKVLDCFSNFSFRQLLIFSTTRSLLSLSVVETLHTPMNCISKIHAIIHVNTPYKNISIILNTNYSSKKSSSIVLSNNSQSISCLSRTLLYVTLLNAR